MERRIQPTPDQRIETSFQQRLALREAQAGILPAELLTPQNRAEQYRKLEGMIGNTPLLYLDVPETHSAILIKDESQNPTESHYDRVYIATFKKLEEDGVIKPGDELWEVTSGSAGISFAWLASRLGYKARIFVPNRLDSARKQEMVNFGAQVDGVSRFEKEVDVAYVPEASEEQTKQFVMLRRQGYQRKPAIETEDYSVRVADAEGKPRVCMVNHSWNHLSHKALEAIGDEISAVIPAGVNIDHFISILGNGSSTRGVSDSLRRRFTGERQLIPGDPRLFRKEIKVIGVENETNPVWFVQKHPGRFEEIFDREPTFTAQQMYGGSVIAGVDLIKFIDINQLDEVQLVTTEEWKASMDDYNNGKQPGETIGRSTAASLALARRLAVENPSTVGLMISYDRSDKYGDPVVDFDQDYVTVPPLGWSQDMIESPVVAPRNLRQAYRPAEQVKRGNIGFYRRKAS